MQDIEYVGYSALESRNEKVFLGSHVFSEYYFMICNSNKNYIFILIKLLKIIEEIIRRNYNR